MIALILAFIQFFLILIARELIKDKISKFIISTYLLFYGFWFLISTLNPFGLYNVSDLVYLIQFLGVFLFFLGFVMCGGVKGENSLMTNFTVRFELDRYKAIKLLLLVSVLIVFHYLTKFNLIVELYGNAGDARMSRFEKGDLFGSTIELLVFNYLSFPIAVYCMAIIAYMSIIKHRYSVIFFLACAYISIYTLIGSGRENIFILITMLILTSAINSIINRRRLKFLKQKNKSKTVKKILIISLVSLFCVFVLSYLTALRQIGTEMSFENLTLGFFDILKNGVVYFVGPFRAFEIALRNNYIEKTGLLFGAGTFGGVEELLGYPLIYFGANFNLASNVIGNLLQNTTISIGPDTLFNFAYTNLLIYYLDFGIFGVILFSFLFGLLVRKCINHFQENPNFFSFTIVLYLFYAILFSVFKWPFQSAASIILFLSACLLSNIAFVLKFIKSLVKYI